MFNLEGSHIYKLIGNVRDKKIIDAGCGTGRYAIPLANRGAIVSGVDFSKDMISKAVDKSKGLDIEYKVSRLEKMPYPNASFDVIVNSLVLCHIRDLRKVFGEFSRVLKRGGTLILSTINPVSPLEVVGPRFMHKGKEVWMPAYPHYLEEFFALFKKYGFELVDLLEPKVTEKQRRFFSPQDFKKKKGRRTLLIMKLRKK